MGCPITTASIRTCTIRDDDDDDDDKEARRFDYLGTDGVMKAGMLDVAQKETWVTPAVCLA